MVSISVDSAAHSSRHERFGGGPMSSGSVCRKLARVERACAGCSLCTDACATSTQPTADTKHRRTAPSASSSGDGSERILAASLTRHSSSENAVAAATGVSTTCALTPAASGSGSASLRMKILSAATSTAGVAVEGTDVGAASVTSCALALTDIRNMAWFARFTGAFARDFIVIMNISWLAGTERWTNSAITLLLSVVALPSSQSSRNRGPHNRREIAGRMRNLR